MNSQKIIHMEHLVEHLIERVDKIIAQWFTERRSIILLTDINYNLKINNEKV